MHNYAHFSIRFAPSLSPAVALALASLVSFATSFSVNLIFFSVRSIMRRVFCTVSAASGLAFGAGVDSELPMILACYGDCVTGDSALAARRTATWLSPTCFPTPYLHHSTIYAGFCGSKRCLNC